MAISALIGALRVSLGMDSVAFEKGANRAEKKLDGIARAGFNTGRAIKGAAAGLAGLAAGFAAVFASRAVTQALDYAASLGEISSQLGVTSRELQVYRFAATQVNLTNTEIEKGLQKLGLTIGKATSGAKAEARAFDVLGISLRNSEGNLRSTGDVLLDVAERIAAIPDPAKRAAAAYALFGRQGQQLLPLLEGGRKGLEDFARQAEEAGAIISDDLSNKADVLSDRMAALNQQLSIRFATVVAENATAIQSMADALFNLTDSILKFWRSNPKATITTLSTLSGVLIGGRVGGLFGALGGGAVGFIAGRMAGRKLEDQNVDLEFRLKQLKEAQARLSQLQALGGRGIGDPRSGPMRAAVAEVQRQTELLRAATAAHKTLTAASDIGTNDPLGELFGTGGGGGGVAKRARDAAADVRQSLGDVRKDIEAAFSVEPLPESIASANALRERLDEIGRKAREAGVPMAQFSTEVATLKARIGELETEGLVREADAFADAVGRQAQEVREFAQGGLPVLEARLADVDDRYQRLREDIEEAIRENSKLAEANDTAAEAMRKLEMQLLALERGHKLATDAAVAQHRAEQALADVTALRERTDIAADIEDLRTARGDSGAMTQRNEEMRRIERQLNDERIDATRRLIELEAQKAEAERLGDQQEAARLQQIIDLQRIYHDEVLETTAAQILAAQRIQDAYDDFASSLSDSLAGMIMEWDFSLKGIAGVFRKLANDLFIKPGTDALSGVISSAIGSITKSFAGGFATGGVIPRGQWGVVGEEGPEIAFGGRGGMTVLPNGGAGGGVYVAMTVNATDANSFRATERQLVRQLGTRVRAAGL